MFNPASLQEVLKLLRHVFPPSIGTNTFDLPVELCLNIRLKKLERCKRVRLALHNVGEGDASSVVNVASEIRVATNRCLHGANDVHVEELARYGGTLLRAGKRCTS